ncbi:aldo/keto reductase [Paraflavitalea sp. CAU 1676]|uniref:aldo/keto reductase n=1 Tax=Paraflavitalea sp. CAU 1676 TaxID=3032598 RepID=UPI0023D9B079|nr:aldo/keto reductase [Paraflavitalea sp. CAU 1676]MDF2187610.1 aldo/keto reductase [Paraflavitalea sp. CAU 1676]
MNYHILGKSTLEVSAIGFGCMSLGNDHAANATLIQQAIDGGINYFDTADVYQQGFNEITVGKAIAGKRQEVLIATKAGNQLREDGNGFNWNASKQYILSAVEESLKRLGTDYIDLFQLHGGTIDDPIDETIEAFEQLQQEGKIRYYGISSIRPNVIREYVDRSKMSSVMMQYSMLDRRPEESCLPLLKQQEIGVLARGSVAKGLLIDKPAATYLNYSEKEVEQAARAVQHCVTPLRGATQVALRFVLQQPGITAAIVGIRNTEQLNEALKTIDSTLLSADELELFRNAIPLHVYDQHR